MYCMTSEAVCTNLGDSLTRILDLVRSDQNSLLLHITFCIHVQYNFGQETNIEMGNQPSEPTALSNDGDITKNWLKWKKEFLEYLEKNNYTEKSEDLKIHLLKTNIGEHGLHAIATIDNCNNLEMLLEKLDTFFEVPESEVVKRYNFFTSLPKKDQSIDNYILELKEKAIICDFGNLTDSLIRDKIIINITDKQLQSKLLETEDLNLIKLMSVCHDYEKLYLRNVPMKYEKCYRTSNRMHKQKACPAHEHKCEKCGECHNFTNCCTKISPIRSISNLNINHQKHEFKNCK
ncbi:uncharacterized protein LOC117223668 isoform X3 [Megalopta genalis]|uniref:uncharacterized protein LOC117223668 isoform X3 n=1 Tax=Megalopta genalis TaxID=115081 RepID=UPI003FD50BDF